MTDDQRLLVGIDGGTQSTKVLVFDIDGNVVARGTKPLRPMDQPRKGVAEHPDDDLWDSLQVAARQAMDELGDRVTDIVGIGLCSIRFCRALMRADQTLAQPVLSWMDERVARPHEPNPAVAHVGAASAYVTARLTGRVADSVANYAGIWPIDHDTWNWSSSDDALAQMGLSRELLPELVMPGDVLGSVTDQAAAATGLPAGVPVVATANDKAVEALGNGLLTSDQLLLSLGTYITTMRPAPERRDDTSCHWSNFASMPKRYLDESSGIRRGMSTISWLRDLMSAELTERATSSELSVEDVMNAEAARVPAGSEGLMTVLDWLAPAHATHRRGAMVGFDARHGWPHIYRSMLEGIAMTMRQRSDEMATELHQEVTSIVVAGGGSGSDPMMQIVADVFAVPALRTRVTSGAGLGSAVCAAVATGVHPDFETAVDAMVQVATSFEPIPENVNRYAELLDVYRGLPALLDQPFRQIHDQGL